MASRVDVVDMAAALTRYARANWALVALLVVAGYFAYQYSVDLRGCRNQLKVLKQAPPLAPPAPPAPPAEGYAAAPAKPRPQPGSLSAAGLGAAPARLT